MRIIRKKGRPQCYGYEKSQLKICTPENMGSKNITLTKHSVLITSLALNECIAVSHKSVLI